MCSTYSHHSNYALLGFITGNVKLYKLFFLLYHAKFEKLHPKMPKRSKSFKYVDTTDFMGICALQIKWKGPCGMNQFVHPFKSVFSFLGGNWHRINLISGILHRCWPSNGPGRPVRTSVLGQHQEELCQDLTVFISRKPKRNTEQHSLLWA